jgi:hypothetical protein
VWTFKRLLVELGNHDVSCQLALEQQIDAVGWNFMFEYHPIFLNLFAPCYPAPHSKRIDDGEHIYVFLQPEFTFDFCNVNRSRTTLKDEIRSRFDDAGMPYDGETIDSRRKALSYVFPLTAGAPPIAWWTAAGSADRVPTIR